MIKLMMTEIKYMCSDSNNLYIHVQPIIKLGHQCHIFLFSGLAAMANFISAAERVSCLRSASANLLCSTDRVFNMFEALS